MLNLSRKRPPNPFDHLPEVPAFDVTSSDLADGGALAREQLGGDGGGNTSPALRWSPGPLGTVSYAVTMIDPDAPTPGGVHHWILVDIPGDVCELPAGALDIGRQGRNDLGTLRYEGAAPPPGDHAHRYIFTVHALGVGSLNTDDGTPAALTGFHITVNSLARGSVIASA